MPKHDLPSFSAPGSGYHLAFVHTNQEAHQVAWLFDHHFETRFWRNDKIMELAKQKSEHSCFYYHDDATEDDFWLMANQGSDGMLVSGKPRPDLVLVGKGDSSLMQIKQWLEKLKSLGEISLAYAIPAEKAEKMKWLLWLELENNEPDE